MCILYTGNLLRVDLKHSHHHTCKSTQVNYVKWQVCQYLDRIPQWRCKYHIITLYILNIFNYICQLFLNKVLKRVELILPKHPTLHIVNTQCRLAANFTIITTFQNTNKNIMWDMPWFVDKRNCIPSKHF